MASKNTSTPMLRALAACIHSNTPALLWGSPGVGKTASLTAHGEAWGYRVETVVGSIREASDFMGRPVVDHDTGTVRYSPLSWAQRLVDAERGLLFLDELTTAPPSVQRAMLRIAQEREVGEITLPDTVSIVAAANPPEIAVDGWDLAAPVANRFVHLDWFFDADSWLDGVVSDFASFRPAALSDMLGSGADADQARVRGAVTAFLRSRRDLHSVVPTDPALAGKGWPSPRSWTNAMSVLGHLHRNDEDAALIALKGAVGEGAAIEYLAWLATADLHDPEDVLANPDIVAWSDERPVRLWALIGSVSALVTTRADKATWEKGVAVLIACAEGNRPDVAMPAALRLLNNVPKGAKIPQAAQRAFSSILTRSGRLVAA